MPSNDLSVCCSAENQKPKRPKPKPCNRTPANPLMLQRNLNAGQHQTMTAHRNTESAGTIESTMKGIHELRNYSVLH